MYIYINIYELPIGTGDFTKSIWAFAGVADSGSGVAHRWWSLVAAMGVWRDISSSEDEQEEKLSIPMRIVQLFWYHSPMILWWIQPLVQDCKMTVEQESFIYCGALFLQLAGLLAKHFTGIYLVSFQMASHLATSSLGLSHFLRRWRGTFGYISDCSLSCKWPTTEQNWRSEDPGCNISIVGGFSSI